MGRGRQKAKQTKVARELKYHSSSIDVTALQRELSGEPISDPRAVDDPVDEVDVVDDEDLNEDDGDDGPYSGYYTDRNYTNDGGQPSAGYASQRRR